MTPRELVRKLKKIRPKTAKDMRRAGFHLRYLNEGCFRQVYKIVGTSAVIKFPNLTSGNLESTKEHIKQESRGFQKIRKQKRGLSLRPYLPVIYYKDLEAGVTAMKYYQSYRRSDPKERAKLTDFLMTFFHYESEDRHDYGYGNFGMTPEGRVKILDLGMC